MIKIKRNDETQERLERLAPVVEQARAQGNTPIELYSPYYGITCQVETWRTLPEILNTLTRFVHLYGGTEIDIVELNTQTA